MLSGLIVFLAFGLTVGLAGPAQAQSAEAPAETTRIAQADVASTARAPDALPVRIRTIERIPTRHLFHPQIHAS